MSNTYKLFTTYIKNPTINIMRKIFKTCVIKVRTTDSSLELLPLV